MIAAVFLGLISQEDFPISGTQNMLLDFKYWIKRVADVQTYEVNGGVDLEVLAPHST
jgi:hypothetical protein